MRAKSLLIVSLLIIFQFLLIAVTVDGEEYPREISLVDEVLSFDSVILVPPGEDFTVTFDPQGGQLLPKREPQLPIECMEALDLVPAWMRLNLTHKFRLLSSNDRITFANLIRNSPNASYRDEIGFVIAHSTPETLSSGNFFPQLLTQNAELIYEYDQYLDYVRIVEKKDYTTLSYKQSDGSWLELPKDDYYWFVVHPKLGDELPTYVDPDYNYTTEPPFDRNHGVAPPVGKYWREWFFEYNKTGQPLLLDRLKGKNTTLDAIKAINGWIGASMIFTSDNERPVQPVRIYVKGKGRCGEYQDMRSAAARAALIPVIATSNTAEDHVWNEFWDVDWHHWDGMIDNPTAYEKGWGKTLSSVWNSRGDGYTWSVTPRYSETATINALVRDLAGLPVDGAEVGIYTENFYQPEIKTETFDTVTDSTGRISVELGDQRNYWGRADTTDLGSDPTNPVTQNEIVMNTSAGEEYPIIFRLPQSAPRLQFLPTGNAPVRAEPNDPFFNIDFEVIGQITRGEARVASGRYDLYNDGGNIDFFIADRANTAAYNNDVPFMGYYAHERTSNFSLSIKVSSDDQWTYVLSNKFSQQTYKVIRVKVSVETDTYLSIENPSEGQRISLGETFEVSGVVRTSLVEPSVEISHNGGMTWRSSTVEMDDNGTYHYNTFMSISAMDPYSFPSLPLERTILSRISGNNDSIVATTFLLVDEIKPEITGRFDRNSVPQGATITLTGSANDNMVVDKAYYSLDSPRKERPLEFMNGSWFSLDVSTAGMEAGMHELWIIADDLYDNTAEESFPFEVLESEPPKIEIFSPGKLDLLKHGDPIPIEGRVRDNVGVDFLSVSISGERPKDIDLGELDDQGYFTYTLSYSPSSVGEGYQELEFTARDGSQNTASEGFLIILDGERPRLTLDSNGPITVSPTTDLEITGKLSDDHGIGSVDVLVNGRSGHDVKLSTASGAFSLDLRPSFDLDAGENTITFRGYDSVGWMTEVELVIVVDGEAPVILFDETPSFIMKGEELDVRAVIEDDNDITDVLLLIPGAGTEDVTGDLDVADLPLSIDTSKMRTGKVEVSVHAIDAAGNTGEASFSINVITDSLDSDGDGVPDWWEYKYGMDPFTFDSDEDPDGDHFTNLEEFLGNDGIWGTEDDSTDPKDTLSKPSAPSQSGSIVPVIILIIVIVIVLIGLLVLGLVMSGRRRFQETS